MPPLRGRVNDEGHWLSPGFSGTRFLVPAPTPARPLRLDGRYPEVGPRQHILHPPSAPVPKASGDICSALLPCGRLAFPPGEFQPDCQRIPAEIEVSLMPPFNRTRTGWVERAGRSEGEDVSKEARSHFVEATG